MVSAFKFPEKEDLRTKWTEAVPRENWTPTKYSYICILHFKDDDFNSRARKTLCQSAIPSIFPFTRKNRKRNVSTKRKLRRDLALADHKQTLKELTAVQTENNSTVKLNQCITHKGRKVVIFYILDLVRLTLGLSIKYFIESGLLCLSRGSIVVRSAIFGRL